MRERKIDSCVVVAWWSLERIARKFGVGCWLSLVGAVSILLVDGVLSSCCQSDPRVLDPCQSSKDCPVATRCFDPLYSPEALVSLMPMRCYLECEADSDCEDGFRCKGWPYSPVSLCLPVMCAESLGEGRIRHR